MQFMEGHQRYGLQAQAPRGAALNYYPLHIGDYLRDTSHLSLLEDGAYRRMLDLYYASERPLPLNLDGLYRLIRAKSKAEREAVDTVLEEFFRRDEDGWHNARADEEIAKARDKSGKAKVSAEKRWQSDRTANASGGAMQTHSEGNAPNNQKPVANSRKPKPKATDSYTESSAVTTTSDAERRPSNGKARSAPTWLAFQTAYRARYDCVEHRRNAAVNAQMLAFIEKVGVDDAPRIAEFYVSHNSAWYVKHSHAVKYLMQNAESLATEWARGRRVTETEARQADRTAATGEVFNELIDESRRVA